MELKLYLSRSRSLCFLLLLIFQSSFSFSQQVAKQIPNATSPDGRIGFLEFKPKDYGTQLHPLIIFLHGIGERGDGASQIYSVANNAIPLYCSQGATMRFTVAGQTSSFVVLSPQLSASYGYWPSYYVKEMVNYAKANLQIDPNRIYVTGLSLGGGGVWGAITDSWDPTFDAGIAAAAPVCGTQQGNDAAFCGTIGTYNLPIWAFHSMDDGVVNVAATQHYEQIAKSCPLSPAGKFTYYQTGNHGGAWINAYDTGHITRTVVVNGVASSFTANPNLYEWFLSYKRGAVTNTPPIANAGTAQAITLPLNSVTLTGTGTGTNGATISSYSWAKTSGPAGGTINIPLANTTLVTGLVQGTYVFTLTVTDNHGLSNTSNVTITVNPLINQPPVANAGSNIAITLPTNSSNLNGTVSSDPDGTIATYAWSKTSGPASYTIANTAAASTALSNLVQGVYVFTLQVTDNAGATASSTVTVTVNPAPNQPPVANAGSNIVITLPSNSTTLNGTASSDPDGTIATYAWSKTSGPASYTIANTAAASTALSNLVQGVYVFTLQVTDNAGATASSTVTVTVNAAAPPPPPVNQSPVANAGSNIVITLPSNSSNLNGTASSDPDGTIATYAWSKTSGPASYTIANTAAASTALSNLVQGVYVFTLQVTDNAGATASSTVTVTVNAAAPPPPPVNQSPVANAGSNIVITLPSNSTTLNGTASTDPDGTIATYAWSKTSGPASYTIANTAAASTVLSSLAEGVYVFTLQVTDNAGATASSTVTVTVNAAPAPPPPVNQAPVANAGSNIVITLPISSTTLNGAASSDADGTISTYAWSKTSGPGSYSIATAGAATTVLSNLAEGVYVFTLQVTDNAGATASSSVMVTVNPAPNQAPVANAGVDIAIVLPVNTTLLDGSSSSDPDGTITSYSWNKISGTGAITIVNSNTPNPSVIGLSQGQYIFELTVTDNKGTVATDQVVVTVNPAPNKAPVANAGKDTSISLPSAVAVLSGINSTDADGSIAQYSWKQVSGPSAAVIVQAAAVTTTVSGLVEGDYIFELKVTDNAGAAATARVTISLVNNFRFSQFFKLYPNPATSSINFQYIDDKTGKLKISTYDVNGRLVLNEEFSKDQSLITKEINISQLKSGMYYLEINQADGKKLIRPFVKQ